MDPAAASSSARSTPATPGPAPEPPSRNALGKNEFLKLLTAQLSNQDPLKPVDNQAFVAQLAQFASLEQLHGVTQRLDSLLLASASATQLNTASLVGKTVAYRAEGVDVAAGAPPPAVEATLATRASVTALVQDAAGHTVRTLALGAVGPGTFPIGWDGRDERGSAVAAGHYALTVTARAADGTLAPVELRTSGKVQGVDFTSGGAELVVGASRVKLSDVSQITQP